MMTVSEAAKELRVSTRSVYRWIKSGKIPALQIDHTIRIPREEFRDILNCKK
jgi:excisionase family DNA binding protein